MVWNENAAQRSPATKGGKWKPNCGPGADPTGANPVTQDMREPIRIASGIPDNPQRKRTLPNEVHNITARVVTPTSGRAKPCSKKLMESKANPIPARVANIATAGVTRRMNLATKAMAISIMPDMKQAAEPTCQATWIGSDAPVAAAKLRAGNITRST